MPREEHRPKSTENGLGHSVAPEYPEDELQAVARRYRVPIEAAPTWSEYDRAMSVWRQRCLALLAQLLGAPDAYMLTLAARKAKKDRRPSSQGWVLEQRAALEEVIEQIMALATPGQTRVGLALEISAEFERHLRHPIILELCQGGWLPKSPLRPDTIARQRDPKDEATRMAAADVLAREMVDDEPEAAHDGRARAAGEL